MAKVSPSHVGALEPLIVNRIRRIINDIEELTIVRTIERIG